jgi:hypothetical protein
MKCGKEFPKKITIDGKRRNLQTRKFCFECSPFGSHNTRDLKKLEEKRGSSGTKFCPDCGQEHTQRCHRCFACYFQRRQKQIVSKVQEITGNRCWFCGYNSCWQALAFHHINPQDKSFGLTTRELVGTKWESVFTELKKCVLCCHNCHTEIHVGLIPEAKVSQVFNNYWNTGLQI